MFRLLFQIPLPFLWWIICISIKIVFVSTLCCFLLLYQIPPPFLRWGMTWGGAEALFVRLGAASGSEYYRTLFDTNKMYLNIYQNGANHYFGLIDLLVKRGTIISHFCSCMVLLKRVYSWTTSIKHWIMAYHSFTLYPLVLRVLDQSDTLLYSRSPAVFSFHPICTPQIEQSLPFKPILTFHLILTCQFLSNHCPTSINRRKPQPSVPSPRPGPPDEKPTFSKIFQKLDQFK